MNCDCEERVVEEDEHGDKDGDPALLITPLAGRYPFQGAEVVEHHQNADRKEHVLETKLKPSECLLHVHHREPHIESGLDTIIAVGVLERVR